MKSVGAPSVSAGTVQVDSGPVIVTRSRGWQVRPASPRQRVMRDALTLSAATWRAMSGGHRASWDDPRTTSRRMASRGSGRTVTGYSAYISRRLHEMAPGVGSTMTDQPVDVTWPMPQPLGAQWDWMTGTLTTEWDADYSEEYTRLYGYLTRPGVAVQSPWAMPAWAHVADLPPYGSPYRVDWHISGAGQQHVGQVATMVCVFRGQYVSSISAVITARA